MSAVNFQNIKKKVLWATTALTVIPFSMSGMAHADPAGGVVTAGNASISKSGTTTSILQTTDRAIIDWRSFDVGASEQVLFLQPNVSSFILNRINDSKASQIDGNITANGRVMLLNQNGIVFGQNSRVDVAGLIATTSQVDDAAFMSGANTLRLTPGNNPNASIINRGLITAREAGLVGLVAPTVENSGVIEAHLGKVTLAGAERVTLDLAGDDLITIDVTDQVNGLVKNSGSITADGGTITLSASRAKDAVQASIINTGTLRANTVETKGGRILLRAGGHQKSETTYNESPVAAIQNSGTIEAKGDQVGEKGGDISLIGDSIKLSETSVIDTSGLAGGGVIKVGGDYQGGGNTPTATWVAADKGSTARSNGGYDGDGGEIFFWADRLMYFRARIEAEGGEESGNGGLVEVSGKNRLVFDGEVSTKARNGKFGTLLLDPTDIVISNAADQDVTAGSPYEPNADDVTSILNITTLQTALASSSVIVQTRATGSQAGDITLSNALTWGSGNTLTLSAANNIVINATISGGGLTLSAGNDVQINSAISGTGTLWIKPESDATTIGIAGGAGTLNLSTTDLGNISAGWANVTIGRTDGTGAMTVNAQTWINPLTLQTGSGALIISGTQTMGANNLSIITDSNIALNANLTGTGELRISQASASTTIGLGNSSAGVLNFTAAEVGRITNGWANLVFGRTDGTGLVTVGTLTWNDNLTLQTGTGGMNIWSTQSMGANALTLISDADIILTAALTGTGNLTIQQSSASTTMGLGNAAAGILNLDAAEIGQITNGWANLVFGRTDGSGAIEVTSNTWNDFLTLQTGSGVMTISGTQTMTANTLTLMSDADIVLTGALTGTGTLNIKQSSASTTMGLGNAAAGTLNLDAAEVGRITNGWANLVFGRTDGSGAVEVTANTWNDVLTLQSGSGGITISGTQTMAANNLTISTDSDLAINGALTGTGTLTIQSNLVGTDYGLGTGQSGTIQLTNAEIANITNGWASLVFGLTTTTGGINVGALTWNDALTLRTASGVISINGTQTMGANNITISTDANLNIGGALTSTGTLTITGQSNATTIGLGTGQAGTLSLTNAEIANITNGWASLVFGLTTGTGAVNVGALTWNDALTLRTASGVISINGTQTMGANNITVTTDADLNIGGALTSTGTLTISGQSTATTMGLGTGQTGTLSLTNAEIANITNGWSSLVFGNTGATTALNVGALTWNDALTLRTSTGGININGIQTMGANNLTVTTNADLNIGAALNSTGTLTISTQTPSTTIGIGTGQTGTLSLTDTELGNITNGWAGIVLGNTTGTAAVNVGAYTWNDNLTLRSSTGVITINGAQTMGANSLTITADSNLAVNGALTGTGTLSISGQTASTTMGVGTGQTGTLSLTDTELGNFTDGWTSIIIGRTAATGAMNVGAYTWNDVLSLRTGSGLMTIGGAQTMGANNLTLSTDSSLALNGALTGTGTLVITPSATGTTVGVGTGQTGTLALSNTELGNITDGWASIIIGASGGTGAINIGARTWNDNLTLRSAAGLMTINGIQTMGANNLTINTDSNLALNAALTGTGNLSIAATTAATTMAIGSGQTGTIQIDATELGRLTDGWTSITFGQTGGTGAINIGASTFLDNTTITSNTGVITVNGAMEAGANNLTFSTNANPAFNAMINGTGTLSVVPVTAATTMGIGGGTGTINLSSADLDKISSNWDQLVFGLSSMSGTMNLSTYTWLNNVTFKTGTGIITVGGAQANSPGKNMTFETDGNMAVTANIGGSGTLTIRSSAAGTQLNIATGSTGLNLTTAELAFIQDGWSQIVFGKAGTTGAVNVGAKTWTDNVQFISGLGTMTVAAQTMGANNLTMTTNSNLALTGNLTGTGQLVIEGSTTTTGIGVGTGQAGTLNLTAAELAFFVTGWSGIQIGNNTSTAAINIGAKSWSTPMTFISRGNIVLNGAQTSTLTSGTSLAFVTLAGAFVNNAGATPISPGTGTARYLIYSVAAGSDTYGTMSVPTAINTETYYSMPPASVTSGVNRIIYSSGAAKIIYVQIDSKSKVYGDATPVLTWTYMGGLQGSDALGSAITSSTLTATGATTSDAVGVIRTISGSFVTGLGYSVSVTDGSLSVAKAPVLITADAQSRFYGDADPTFTYTYTGLKNSETASVIDTLPTATSTATILSNVGAYTITPGGASDNNYSFTYANGTLTINKATLTLTADNKSREYGLANPALTISYSGFKNGEDSTVIDTAATISTAATTLSNVGGYAISLSGGTDNNYNLVLNDGTLSVTKAMLTATADDKSREYGLTNPTMTFVYTGFRNGDTASVIDTAATGSTSATATSNVGSYTISGSAASDNNYDFTYVDGTLSVTKAMLTATADGKSREYGLTNPALTFTYTGFRNGDTASVIDTAATGSTSATITSNVGSYTISGSAASDNNYDFTYVDGTLSVTKAMLTATADDKSREYGLTNPTLTFTYTGFRNGDTASVIDTAATGSTSATATSNVGGYAISGTGASDNNYDFTYVDGTLSVTKAMLTATADDKSREYGLTNPTMTFVYTGFRNGDTASVIDTAATGSTSATAASNVGSYTISGSAASDNNYDFTYVDGTLSVTKAMLTATADDKSREYGLTNPALTFTYTGFRNGDTASVIDTAATGSTAATSTSNVGSYAISGSAASDNNYDFTYVDGTLSVTKATLVVTATDKTKYLDDVNPLLTYSVSGLRAGDTSSILTGVTLNTLATINSPRGNYAIDVTGPSSTTNYNVTYSSGVLTILAFAANELPSGVILGQSDPGLQTTAYDRLYRQSRNDNFMTTGGSVFMNGENGFAEMDQDGFVQIGYYSDPFASDEFEPLIYIEDELYKPIVEYPQAQKRFVMNKR